jgi:hypothetical protein
MGRIAMCAALVVLSSAAIVRADAVDVGGFQLTAPTGFVRGPEEQALEASLEANSPMSASEGLRTVAVRIFRRVESELHSETIVLHVIATPDIDPDDPSFARGISGGLLRSIGTGGHVDSTRVRTVGDGLRGPELRASATREGAAVRAYLLAIPRSGHAGTTSYITIGIDAKETDARWETIVRSVRSPLGEPVPASAGSPAYRLGKLLGMIAVPALVVVWLVRSRGRRRDEARRREFERRRAERTGS